MSSICSCGFVDEECVFVCINTLKKCMFKHKYEGFKNLTLPRTRNVASLPVYQVEVIAIEIHISPTLHKISSVEYVSQLQQAGFSMSRLTVRYHRTLVPSQRCSDYWFHWYLRNFVYTFLKHIFFSLQPTYMLECMKACHLLVALYIFLALYTSYDSLLYSLVYFY